MKTTATAHVTVPAATALATATRVRAALGWGMSPAATVQAVLAALREGREGRLPAGTRTRVVKLVARSRALAAGRLDRQFPPWRRGTAADRRAAGEVLAAVLAALDREQSRCRERLLGVGEVLEVLARAASDPQEGHARCNGGTITSGSYGYRWETTVASAQAMGSRAVWGVARSYPSARPNGYSSPRGLCRRLAPGLAGDVALRVGRNLWERVTPEGAVVGYQCRLPADLTLWGGWEHASTRAGLAAEISAKREAMAKRAVAQAATQAQERRDTRAARLFARVSAAPVALDAARATGACMAGITAWAAARGVPLDGTVPLRVLAGDPDPQAQRVAQRVARSLIAAAQATRLAR